MEGNLLTADGFPRSDIDVYAVRLDRNKLHMLRNDLRSINNQLAVAMQNAFSSNSSGGEAGEMNGAAAAPAHGVDVGPRDSEHVLPAGARRVETIAVVGQVCMSV